METDTMTDTTSIDPKRLGKLLRRLIDIYSPSGKEEEIQDYLHGYLKKAGLPVVKQEVDDGRDNLIVCLDDDNIEIALVGHVDTVTAHDLEHYDSEKEGDEIYGLGAADMKAGVAAMVESFVCLAGVDDPPSAALCLVVGEEEEGDGARQLMIDYEFPWAVIGEPTDLVACPSHFGYVEIQLSAVGKRRHASMARKGISPVEAILRLTIALTRHLDKERPDTVYNIRDLWSSQSGFAVPENCEAWLDLHLPPHSPIGEIITEIEELVEQDNKSNPGVETSIRFSTVDSGFELPDKGPILESLRDIYEKREMSWAPAPFQSHSDASQLWEAGARPVILGPGKLELAHSPDEMVSFKQTYLAAQIYFDLLKSIGR
jgi:acetylornithine deacetylase